jgi:DNA-binding transcriptional LysR family regulator
MRADQLSGLGIFVRAVETGSFTSAAKALGTTPSAVSKAISKLERRLGMRLFRRSTRAFALTEEGKLYFERVAPLLRAIEDADDSLSGRRSLAGRLKVSLPTGLGRPMLRQITGEFMARHPKLALDVGLSDRHVDLIREGYDLAIRVGELVDTGMISRKLGVLPLVLVASPEYLATHGVPASREALATHVHVRYLLSGSVTPIIFADGKTHIPIGRFDTDNGDALRAAALNGLGIAQILQSSVQDDLDAGQLQIVLAEMPLRSQPVQALHAFGRTVPNRVRAFIDFVAVQLKGWLQH